MIFILITFLAAFLIEGLGTAVSVIGLSTLFGANPIIIALAISLDAGKLVVVSLLYNYWKQMGIVMKSYAVLASLVTMIITSAGAAGYLTGEFQKAILGTQETELKVNVLKEQQAKYEERKKQIDNLIANLPEKTTVNQRIRLMKQFQDEQKALQTKIEEIDKQLPELQLKQIGVEAKAGPILYISKAFEVPVEVAVKYVVLLIIFVFDPLAVFLMVAGNFLLEQRKNQKSAQPSEKDGTPLNSIIQEFSDDDQKIIHEKANALAAEMKKPNAETIAALQEAREITERRNGENHPERGRAEESFIPSVALAEDDAGDFHSKYDPRFEELVGEELIAEPTLSEPVTPEAPEPPSTVAPTSEQEREQIHLHDLKPHRSLLNDARNDEVIHFDQTPQHSVQHSIYKKR